jgi:hypothetical protein
MPQRRSLALADSSPPVACGRKRWTRAQVAGLGGGGWRHGEAEGERPSSQPTAAAPLPLLTRIALRGCLLTLMRVEVEANRSAVGEEVRRAESSGAALRSLRQPRAASAVSPIRVDQGGE